uniref:Uncharacterized protein n=1 Tax=Anguilla anguilla TaxID=7936 RepID=A0A0E9PKD4_ANGAN
MRKTKWLSRKRFTAVKPCNTQTHTFVWVGVVRQ